MLYRYVEYEVVEVSWRVWRWTIYPKKKWAVGKVTREVTCVTRQQAVAQCKAEIDRKLERLHAKDA